MADGDNQTYWEDGLPYPYLSSDADATGGSQKFWNNGLPNGFLEANDAPPPATNDTAMFMMFF
jgi:hypothetical protein